MTIKQLIDKLSKLNPNKEVFTSSDEEGNGYNSISEFSIEEFTKSIVIYPQTEYVDDNEVFTPEELKI